MKTAFRILAAIVVGIVLLLGVAALVLPRVIDPNAYKPRLIALVKEKTGRSLVIGGRIGWSVFPWLGVKVSQVSLGNPPGMAGQPLLSVDSAGLRVRLLPLLHRQVVVDQVRLDGVRVNLLEDHRGRTNWSGLAGPAATGTATPTPSNPSNSSGSFIQGLRIAGVRLRNARVDWTNEQSGSTASLSQLALTVGTLAPGQETPVDLSTVVTEGNPARSFPVRLRAKMAWAPDARQLKVSDLHLDVAGLSVGGTVHAVLSTPPHFDGSLAIAPSNLRAVLAQLGVPVHTRDPRALSSVSASAAFSGTPAAVDVKSLFIDLDGQKMRGSASVRSSGTSHAYALGLAIGALDLDRYRPPPAAKAPTSPGGAAAPAAPVKIPVAALRALNVDARLNVDQLTVFGFHSQSVSLGLRAHGGLIQFAPMDARLYGGSYQGRLSYDARGAVPVVTSEERLDQVQVGPLLKDAHTFDKFSGTGNITSQLTARGFLPAELTRSLNGTLQIALTKGQIQGVDLRRMVSQIEAIRSALRGGSSPLQPASTDHTDFSSLRASAVIRNGVVQNQDLAIDAPPYLQVSGTGTADLVQKSLDYRLLLAGADNSGRQIKIPLLVSGPFAHLSYRPDLAGLLRDNAQQQLQKQQQRLRSRLQEQLDNRLKSLFH